MKWNRTYMILDKIDLIINSIYTPILILDENKDFIKTNNVFNYTFKDNENFKSRTPIHKLKSLDKAITTILDSKLDYYSPKEIFEWKSDNHETMLFFDLDISKLIVEDKYYIMILFKDVTDQYLMAQKTFKRSEELSILLEISLSSTGIKDHKTILKTIFTQITQLTKFNYGFFIFFGINDSIYDIFNFNIPENVINELYENAKGYTFSDKLFPNKKPLIIQKQDFNTLENIFNPLTTMDLDEIIIFKAGIYGIFVFCSNNPHILRISEEQNFFTLLGEEIGNSLHRANLYHRLEHSRNEIEMRNKTLNKQLELAQSIQTSIMKYHKNTQTNVKYAVKYIPSEFLSGDLYDVWNISEDRTSILIADVCGHGVSSALIATFMKANLREVVSDNLSSGEILSQLNNRLVNILPMDMYVSAFLIIVNTKENILEISSAGHPSQFYYDIKSDKIEETKSLAGTLLSIIPNVEFETYIQKYNAGDRVLLFTDGIYEIKDDSGEIYGRKKFKDAVRNHIKLPKEEFLDSIVNNAYEITKQNFLEDDVNLIVIDL